jgi:hypothetical protein
MKKTALAADRAVTFVRFYLRRRFDFKRYPATMAPTAVFDQVNLDFVYVTRPERYRKQTLAA